jgi:hypothetical protein
MCSLLLLQHRVVEVVGFSSSWSFGIGTWSLLLSISSLKLKSCSFINTYIHTSRELHFISLAFYDFDYPKFYSSRSLQSTTFELLLRTISTWCQPNVHTKCTSKFLRHFDLISSEFDFSSELLENPYFACPRQVPYI